MTGPPEPGPHPEPEGEPATAVVEWGGDPPSGGRLRSGRLRLDRLRAGWLRSSQWGGWRLPDRGLGWLPAGLGGLVLFGSLLDSWQVTGLPEEFAGNELEEYTVGLPGVGVWGTGWLVGLTALATCAVLATAGLPGLRAVARSVGLALAGAQLGLLVALSIHLGQVSMLEIGAFITPGEFEFDTQLGRGVYLAYLGLALMAAGLWWMRPGAGVAGGGPAAPAGSAHEAWPGAGSQPPESTGFGGPPDLSVRPVAPFTQLWGEPGPR